MGADRSATSNRSRIASAAAVRSSLSGVVCETGLVHQASEFVSDAHRFPPDRVDEMGSHLRGLLDGVGDSQDFEGLSVIADREDSARDVASVARPFDAHGTAVRLGGAFDDGVPGEDRVGDGAGLTE